MGPEGPPQLNTDAKDGSGNGVPEKTIQGFRGPATQNNEGNSGAKTDSFKVEGFQGNPKIETPTEPKEKKEEPKEKPAEKSAVIEKEFDLPPKESVFPFLYEKGIGGKIKDLFSKEEPIGEVKAKETLGGYFKEQAKNLKEKFGGFALNSKEFLSKLDKKKFAGTSVAGFAGAAVSKSLLRNSIRYGLSGLTGYVGAFVAGGVAGATVGGVWEGRKIFREERKRLKENPLSEEDALNMAKEIGKTNESLQKKLDEYNSLKAWEDGYADFGKVKHFEERKAELYKDIRKEAKVDSKNWKKIWKAVGKGAAIGFVVGAISGTAGHALGEYFERSGGTTGAKGGIPKARDALPDAEAEPDPAVAEKIEDVSAETYSKNFELFRSEGVESLKERLFSAVANRGDSATTLARNMIHDFIAENDSLENGIKLSREELVIAEDHLKNLFGNEMIHPDVKFQLKGEDILSVIEKAKGFSDVAKKEIEEKWVNKISEEAWKKMEDYSTLLNKDNNFHEEILKNAKEKAMKAVLAIREQYPSNLAYHEKIMSTLDSAGSKAVEAAKNSYLGAWLAGAGISVGIGGVAMLERKSRSKNKKEGYIDEDERGISSSDEYLDEIKKQGEIKEGKIESVEKPKARKEIVDKRLIKDPAYEFFKRSKEFNIFPGEVMYEVGGKTFDTYQDLKEYFAGLPDEEKKTGVRVEIPPDIREYVKTHPELNKKFVRKMKMSLKKISPDIKLIWDIAVPPRAKKIKTADAVEEKPASEPEIAQIEDKRNLTQEYPQNSEEDYEKLSKEELRDEERRKEIRESSIEALAHIKKEIKKLDREWVYLNGERKYNDAEKIQLQIDELKKQKDSIFENLANDHKNGQALLARRKEIQAELKTTTLSKDFVLQGPSNSSRLIDERNDIEEQLLNSEQKNAA